MIYMDKILVIYYSYTGNSKKVAEYVKDKLDADILELESVEPFSSDYDDGKRDEMLTSKTEIDNWIEKL